MSLELVATRMRWIGRPMRLAFLEERGRFRAVEARSGEKGPFTNLAMGPMGREDALGRFSQPRSLKFGCVHDHADIHAGDGNRGY